MDVLILNILDISQVACAEREHGREGTETGRRGHGTARAYNKAYPTGAGPLRAVRVVTRAAAVVEYEEGTCADAIAHGASAESAAAGAWDGAAVGFAVGTGVGAVGGSAVGLAVGCAFGAWAEFAAADADLQ